MKFRISNAGPDDIELLTTHRLKMWQEIHPELATRTRKSAKSTHVWIGKNLSEGRLVGFIAKTPDGEVAGSGCIWIRDEQPRPTNPRQEVPYLMSMYTERGFRRKGVAKLIVADALKWCKRHKYERIILHASKEGAPLYEAFGFEPTTEMRLKL